MLPVTRAEYLELRQNLHDVTNRLAAEVQQSAERADRFERALESQKRHMEELFDLKEQRSQSPKARARILEEEFDAKIASLRTEATKASLQRPMADLKEEVTSVRTFMEQGEERYVRTATQLAEVKDLANLADARSSEARVSNEHLADTVAALKQRIRTAEYRARVGEASVKFPAPAGAAGTHRSREPTSPIADDLRTRARGQPWGFDGLAYPATLRPEPRAEAPDGRPPKFTTLGVSGPSSASSVESAIAIPIRVIRRRFHIADEFWYQI
jgi:septal ring factor EnvC (AmiA/AmiB activator)